MLSRPESRDVERSNRGRSWLQLLLLVPFIAMLWPPFYNFTQPDFIGIPFFYWFQLLWIIITAVLMGILYMLRV